MSTSHPDERVRAAWAADRSYLFAVALGMLGQPADAEEVVQEAFARLAAHRADQIDDVRGWLVVVTRRLCIDRFGSAASRRTITMAEPPTPDPRSTANDGISPADRVTLDDEVRQALAVVIDRLSPAERTSFILHDIFGFPFDAVAELVGRTPAACRQLARRARLSVRSGSSPKSRAQSGGAAELAQRFIAVCDGGDVQGLIDLLDAEVAGMASVVGLPPLPLIRGREAVAERVMTFFGPTAGVSLEPFSVEGRPAVVARRGAQVVAVLRLDERGGLIYHLHAIARQPGRTPG